MAQKNGPKNTLEIIPYSLFFTGIVTMVLGFPKQELFVYTVGGMLMLIVFLIVIPYYASKASSLGILGSPCRWGGHRNTNVGYAVVCIRCGKKAIDYK